MPLTNNKLVFGSLIGLGAMLLFLHLEIRSRHHWDEFAYLYGAQHYSASALASGQFEASNIIGFNASRIGHVLLLQILSKILGDGVRGIASLQAVFTGMVIATSLMVGSVSLLLWRNFWGALGTGILSLLAPLSVYLGPKLLSEVPSTFGAVASVLLLVVALRVQRRALSQPLLVLSAIFLTGAVLSRVFTGLLVVGAWLSLIAVCPPGMNRRETLKALVIVSALTMGFVTASYRLLGVDALGFTHELHVVSPVRTPIRQRVEQATIAFGPLLILAPLAVVSKRRQESYFYSIWACFTLVPAYAALGYIESRYLINALPAMAALAMLGSEVVLSCLGAPKQPVVALACVSLVGLLFARANSNIQPRTFWNFDATNCNQVMNRISEQYPRVPILVAWTYEDYHYLRVAYPNAPLYAANTWVHAIGPGGYAENTESWIAAQQRWYGDRFVGNLSALERLSPPPWLFLNWGIPNWRTTNHDSWMWANPCLRMTPLFAHGAYQVFSVSKADSQASPCQSNDHSG